MRHCTSVKAILCLPVLFVSYASADEAADRIAIDRAIAALNEMPPRATLFTEDSSSELERLPNVRAVAFRILRPSGDLVSLPRTDHPSVTISHEPWGEATIALAPMSPPALEILNPRIVSSTIRFITPNVALADGEWTYKDGATTQSTPLLFVMKKEGDSWKIASLRVLTLH
ncbi:MAG: hypothetical protein JWO80_1343 [Bryobacterales bacterium]|nr:hypothetical protein [Bryobacterales bacterium]